jgi:beta-lactamase superfamily II metal-dependent hydrolase
LDRNVALRYVAKTRSFKATLREEQDSRSEIVTTLLWGDPLHVLGEEGGWTQVRARGRRPGWLPAEAVSDESLLEIYIIDVGQGDGVLLKTPDEKWHLIDAGVENAKQMTKKGAANFVRWKFLEDLREEKVRLENVVLTHPDADHFGGLLDLFSGRLAFHPHFEVEVERFFHNGIPRFAATPRIGRTSTGTVEAFPVERGLSRAGRFLEAELLDTVDSFAPPPRPFAEEFGRLAAAVAEVPRAVGRLTGADGHLPGYAPGEGDVTIRVLGPILEEFAPGRVGLRMLSSDSVTLNGHSVVLRIDYKQTSVLLTGDLNSESQELLLSYEPGPAFAVDVAKACHHGSEDVHVDFLKAMRARATVVSSGDNEDYAHPRPFLMGAAGRYGREARGRTHAEVLPPLVYSTELARSVKLEYARSQRPGALEETEVELADKRWRFRRLKYLPVSSDLVYGLVNVRTDGEHVLCATMEEKGNDFDTKVFRAGIDI